MTQVSGSRGRRGRIALIISLVAIAATAAVVALVLHQPRREAAVVAVEGATLRPAIHVAMGKVRAPLPYRIVSFHRGRADKRLIRLASELGFNGVQFQIEGSTVNGIKDFAKRDADEHLVDFCHKLGMQVTVWVHEMSDLPPEWSPDWLGPISTDNAKLWKLLDDRYEWVLRDELPNVDGLCLTVVETQVRATDTGVMLKLAKLLRDKCDKYRKSLQVRTFVWYPEEYHDVMAAVKQLPSDQVIMSKCVPQDWNLRGMYASEIGDVGGRPQIIEYDVAGEYFRRNAVANCMPELLKAHFDYEIGKHIAGICVRVDRDDDSVLHQPNEVNLWTLAMLADGATEDLDEIWKAWATNRFGAAAADGVVRALKPTGDVVSEMLNIGPFSFGDTRQFPPIGDEDVFGQLHQDWWWDPATYGAIHERAETGEASFIIDVAAAKEAAKATAAQCLADLELVRDKLAPEDYEILKTRLVTNQVQLAFRAPMAMAVLHYRQMMNAEDAKERDAAGAALLADLQQVRDAATPPLGEAKKIQWLGQSWNVGSPDDYWPDAIDAWAYRMDQLRQGIDPRPMTPRQRAFAKMHLDGPSVDGVPPKSLKESKAPNVPGGYDEPRPKQQ